MTTEAGETLMALRPRARILKSLGEELISSETVALIELVKNAYDADATNVLIRFTGPLQPGEGVVEVIDNGHGMQAEAIREGWMEPATLSKKKKTRSKDLGRRVLGEKGIGRFASSRLADELELITRYQGSKTEIYGIFDWTQFDDEKKYLDEILVLTEKRSPEEILPGGALEALYPDKKGRKGRNLEQGAILRMIGLKREWNDKLFTELQVGLSRLLSPFSRRPDFHIEMKLPSEFSNYSSEIVPPKVIKYPHYSVKGRFDDNGAYELALRVYARGVRRELEGYFLRGIERPDDMLMHGSKKLCEQRFSMEEIENRKPRCGPINFELRIWDRDELGNIVQQIGSTITNLRRDLNAISGITIYRDGFRVLPYGEMNDDWLRLDMRRVQNPTLRLSNNQISGYIEITADGNKNLKDQSNREGLDENPALSDLRSIILLILSEIEAVRKESRPRKKKKKAPAPSGGLFDPLNLKPLRDRIRKKLPDDEESTRIINELEKKDAERSHNIQTVLARYHGLATLGQLIDVVLHDGRHPVAKIVNEAAFGAEDIDEAVEYDESLALGLRKRFAIMGNHGKILSTIFRRIEPFSGRRRGKPVQLHLEKIIDDAVGVLETEFKKSGVEIMTPESQTLFRVDQAEIQEVIANLLLNSLYWLRYTPRGKRRITVSAERKTDDQVDIVFKDTGPGVAPEYRNLIFDPYFSTKPNGVGLGLSIACEIIKDYYGGSIELMETGSREGAAFRITLNKRV